MEDSKDKKDLETEQLDNIAFKDFKGAVTNEEFQAILDMAKEEYLKCQKVVKAAQRFEDRSNEGIASIEAQSAGMPPGLAAKLIEGLKRAANKDAMKIIGTNVKRSKVIVDFLNRFQDTNEMIPYLDFHFLNRK